jgi:hypothetical protein
MSDYECPYCKFEHEHCCDDQIDDGEDQEVECEECGRGFVITAVFSVDYGSQCKDEFHNYKPRDGFPGYLFCENCLGCKIDEKGDQ